jgi:histidyl-tRNA synthetase
MSQKPSLPKGTRDFGPEQMLKRNFILDSIKAVFKKYGFLPLETPAMENLSVLTGKYGDEGDQLLYRVLNSGDFLKKVSVEDLENGSKAVSPKVAEKGLKYDLTVPFARHVVMNQHDIAFPFKRYQIQPVWRADRPQKGRYREFYQCDADVIGTDSLLCEAELMAMVHDVFTSLNFTDYQVSISSRKILEGLAEQCGVHDQFMAFCTVLDKLDKIGIEKVTEELTKLGVSEINCEALFQVINAENAFTAVETFLQQSDIGKAGIEEIKKTFDYMEALKVPLERFSFDTSLARGLSYYTGIIYEVKPTSIQMGTITAGGRYDDLTGIFGLKGVSGVGVSFGVDRIYDTLEELKLFPEGQSSTTTLLITNFDEASEKVALEILQELRSESISTELYPESTKLKKQMTYAHKKGIPFVLMVGSEEIENKAYVLKNMQDGTQETFTIAELISFLLKN